MVAPQENDTLREQLQQRDQTIALLQQQVAWFKQQLYGSKSEKIDPNQLQLLLQGLSLQETGSQDPPPSLDPPKPKGKPRKRRSREETYENLPFEETVVIIPPEVQKDPERYDKIGQEETFEVDIHPPRLFRRKIIRNIYRDKFDRARAPLTARAQPRLIEGIASVGLLVHILISKYRDHLPLYRQRQIFERYGASFSEQSLVRWVQVVSGWLKPLYDYISLEVRKGHYIQADETVINYCNPKMRKGKSSKGYLWVYSNPFGLVTFKWGPSRRAENAIEFLKDFKGLLQADGYEVYKTVSLSNVEIILLGCHSHARRYFKEALEESPVLAGIVIRLIAHLYAVEKKICLSKYKGAMKEAYRESQTSLTRKLLHRIIQKLSVCSLPKSRLGRACTYFLNQWESLDNCYKHPGTLIDNNLVENAIRPTAVGKKNWLFIGHPQAGERTAIHYTILESCKRYGHNPTEYLTDVLTRLVKIGRNPKPEQMADLCPSSWKKSKSLEIKSN